MRDIAKMYDMDMKIVTIDRSPPEVDSRFDGIQFVQGNVMDMEGTWARNNLFDLPRPWLICEDSAHTYDACMGVLRFFQEHLHKGEYLVMEDGILAELDLGDKFDGGPSRALEEFLDNNPGVYEIDTSYCDMFGINATTNPNGYLRKL
jgi:cephalosporin hydroxylase